MSAAAALLVAHQEAMRGGVRGFRGLGFRVSGLGSFRDYGI